MRYLPHTQDDIARMLRLIGAPSVDALFASIPEPLRLKRPLELPAPLAEAQLLEELRALAIKNHPQSRATGALVFAGAGAHPHYIPSAVDALSSRSEFYTAYTPYQPELSQGTLLSIFEFQTMVAELFGMAVANASMYDGASAAAEAVLMARRLTGRSRALLAPGLHPEYAQTCVTYLSGMPLAGGGSPIARLPLSANGLTDLAALREGLAAGDVACVLVQTPSFFGTLEDLAPIAEATHAAGALLCSVTTEPLALALCKAPGDAGADLAVGEGLGLAGPLNLGGPGVGLFAVRDKRAVRAMPGRLVGETVDSQGRPGYVLTLSTREQHIRREKATSNICTNHGLFALRLAIHLSLLGKTGFEALARQNLAKTVFARDLLAEHGLRPRFPGAPFFNELALAVPGGDADAVVRQCARRGVVPGVALGRFFPELKDTLLVAVNETHSREDLIRLAKSMKTIA